MKYFYDIMNQSTVRRQENMETVHENTTKPRENRDMGLSSAIEELDKFLAHKNALTTLLKKIEHATHVSSRIQVITVVVLVLLYLVEGYAAALLCNILSLLLPMFASINAIEYPAFESDTKWLMYWVIFSCVNFLEMFISWLPSYNLLKFVFLGWCMAPGRFSGSEFMYFKVVRPFFLKHRESENEAISDAANLVCQAAEKTVEEFMIARASKLMQGAEVAISQDDLDNEESKDK